MKTEVVKHASTISLVIVAAVIMTACMGAPTEDVANFTGVGPSPTPSPFPTDPPGPPQFAISSGGGWSTSPELKLRARIGAPVRAQPASGPDIMILLGMQREVHDFRP